MRRKMPYAGKIMGLGVMGKAIVMGILVTILGNIAFVESLILVVVSATATGIFGLIIVLVQVHEQKQFHQRLDNVENKVEEKAGEIKAQTQTIEEKTEQIATAVTPEEK